MPKAKNPKVVNGQRLKHYISGTPINVETNIIDTNVAGIMGCYYTLYHNTYAYSLLFYKVYMKRENAGSWNSGLENERQMENNVNCKEMRFVIRNLVYV